MNEELKKLQKLIQAGCKPAAKSDKEHTGWSHVWKKIRYSTGNEMVYDLTEGRQLAFYNQSMKGGK